MSDPRPADRYLSCYYFHGQDFCIVPRHVREDLAWMRDHGADGIFVGVHEADLMGGNTRMVCDLVRDAGLDLWLIPSRIGGLLAGWHRGPSMLSVRRPEWAGRNVDGTPRQAFGPQVSVFHPQVPAAVAEIVSNMLDQFGGTGIVWDELKSLEGEDHSPHAVEALGRPATAADMAAGTARCFGRVNALLRTTRRDLRIACFIYASSGQEHIDACAAIDGLDEFGADGKCWRPGESTAGEGGDHKVLLGGAEERFQAAARANGRRSFTLLETQQLDAAAMDLTLRRLPDLLALKRDHLAYYYYPCNMADPDRYMPLVGRAVAAWRRGG